MFGILLYDILFFTIPAVLTLFIGVSFYRYRSAQKQNNEVPGTYSAEEIKRRKIILIAASIVASVLVLVVIGFVALICMAIAFM